MGFLSGVLGAVKDDENVKHYYPVDKMTETLQKIKSSMHNPDGLSTAVDAVSGALGEWDENLTSRTENVKTQFNMLHSINIRNFHATLDKLRECPPEEVSAKLQTCIKQADELRNTYYIADGFYGALDSKLKDKLKYAISKIHVQVEKFHSAATNIELKAVVDAIQTKLLNLSKYIRQQIYIGIQDLQSYMKNQIQQLYEGLNNMNKINYTQLTNSVDDLNHALTLLEQGGVRFEWRYREDIAGEVRYIGDKALELEKLVRREKEELKKHVDGLRQQMVALKGVFNKVRPAVPDDFQKYNMESGDWAANGGGKIDALISGIERNVEGHIRGILEDIKEDVDAVAKGDGSDTHGLDGIKDRIYEYAQTFNEEGFEGVVRGWIDEILKNNVVKKKLAKWIEKNSRDKFNENVDLDGKAIKPDRQGVLAGAIVNQLKLSIKQAFTAVKAVDGTNIAGNIKSVHSCIQTFKTQVDEKISGENFDDSEGLFMSGIAGAIESVVQSGRDAPLRSHLTVAIQYILACLLSAVAKAEMELRTFALEPVNAKPGSIAANAQAAWTTVKSLESDISEAISAASKSTIDPSDNGLASKIKSIRSTVMDAAFHKTLATVLQGACIKGLGKAHEEVSAIVSTHLEPINKGLAVLQTKVGDDSTTSGTYGNSVLLINAIKLEKDIMAFLDQKVGKDDSVKGSVYRELVELQDCIGAVRSAITKVQQNITSVQKILTGCIKSAKMVRINATNTTAYIFNKLRDDVDIQMSQSVKSIREITNKLYHAKIEKSFSTLTTVVYYGNHEIENIIANDLNSGVKGLLRTMYKDSGRKLTELKLEGVNSKEKFKRLSERLGAYLDSILKYVKGEVKTPMPSPQPAKSNPQSTTVDEIEKAAHKLFDFLVNSGHFDFTFKKHLASLHSLLGAFNPKHFVNANNPLLLDVIKRALSELTDELRKAYVNAYSGAKQITWDQPFSVKKTKEGKDAAKVCLTLFEILSHDLEYLKDECGKRWNSLNIYETDGYSDNPLGVFLKNAGYRVPTKAGVQDGELTYHEKKNGNEILTKLVQKFLSAFDNSNLLEKVDTLNTHLKEYYQVGHLSTLNATKHPCSIFDMLVWFSGLPNNPVYLELSSDGFGDLFEKPKSEYTDDEGLSFTDIGSLSLDAYPHNVTVSRLSGALTAVCGQSHSVLTAVLGHGHADGRYACEFSSNEYKFAYPGRPSTCIDLIAELSCRMYHQLNFLYTHCSRTYDAVSWRDCWYGKEVGGSSWECNEIQCPDLRDNQKGNQMCNQNANQKCEQHPKCGIKSPLQSFLEDGLPGFLPHPYSKAACKITCAAPNHNGIPCKTPMGFTDISVAASHRQQGEHLKEILQDFCGTARSPLTVLCSMLTCILHRTPQTLDDMFAFYYNFLTEWDGSNTKRKPHREIAFTEAVKKANFEDPEKQLSVNSMFSGASHGSNDDSSHRKGDLFSLYKCHYDDKPAITCGRYLQPTNMMTWVVFSSSNADRYLSWIVYLTETFYDLLERLWKDCCKSCNNPGNRCHDKNCVESCAVKAYYKSEKSTPETGNAAKPVVQSPPPKHDNLCKSIAQCPFSRPHLYKYGFVLNSMTNLSGADDMSTKRTCGDFCKTLERVLNKNEKDAAPLATLIYRTIPNFLFKIRAPFIWLNVALWLLSLLYLLHIMVIRLDLLHIKSHLHSPSSHRIAAQSLLAAGRVNKLNRVFYLQP